jgi:hypothetical protein
VGEFSIRKSSKDGLRSQCKKCLYENYRLKNYNSKKENKSSEVKLINNKLVKLCTKCKEEKEIIEFRKDNRLKSGLCCWCKKCFDDNDKNRDNKKKWNTTKNTYLNKEQSIIRTEKKCSLCKVIKPIDAFSNFKYSPDRRSYRCKNCVSKKNRTEESRDKERNRRKKNAEKINKKERYKNKNNLCYKVSKIIRVMIGKAIKDNGSLKDRKATFDYLPYTKQELLDHIKSQFVGENSWMSFDRWGKYNAKDWDDNNSSTWTWQLDHIIPRSEFHYISMEDEEFQKCWALSNLRPLSAKINILDGTRRIRHSKPEDKSKQVKMKINNIINCVERAD